MVEVVLPTLFRIEVPLPKNPLKSVNSYVIKGGDRNLVVDTGMNRPECHEALKAGLDELDVDLGRTDFFITHLHADHLGLVTAFATDTSRVYFNKPEAELLAASKTPGGFLVKFAEFARTGGFPEAALQESMKLHPGFKYSPPNYPPFTIVGDGDVLHVGDYEFTCVHTPGHSIGHLCLYEPCKKLFVSGDHVLGDITPNISAWTDDSDMLGAYLASLDKVYDLEVDLVLPAHRRIFKDLRGRIQELKHHHEVRLEEVRGIVAEQPGTVYEVASRMTWDIVAESWEQFPIMQKWFAAGESASHLRHLEERGAVRKATQDGVFVYETP